MVDTKYIYTTGRRKLATATLRLFSAKGVSTINGKPVEEVYVGFVEKAKLMKPFAITELNADDFYFTVRVKGGGVNAQLEATRLALSKAMTEINMEFRKPLKKAGLLIRDPRMVERKKPGHLKARKSEQYSKR